MKKNKLDRELNLARSYNEEKKCSIDSFMTVEGKYNIAVCNNKEIQSKEK